MRVDIPEDRPRLTLELRDGTEVWISPLTTRDRVTVEEGFEELSEESRFTRFGLGLGHLSESELDYLTDVDQRKHVAWGVSTTESQGIAVGRYITTEEGSAEIALTVMDAWQGRGVGTLLLRVLTAVGRADGLEYFCFRYMPGNKGVQRMLKGLEVHLNEADGLMEGQVSLEVLPRADWDQDAVMILDQVRG
ncbi:MAG: GNAT family N-acetyltransferase [Actinomycetota bacterium]|nr:GNAT family N-acetyltransferase [Actinomycetota bacterium]